MKKSILTGIFLICFYLFPPTSCQAVTTFEFSIANASENSIKIAIRYPNGRTRVMPIEAKGCRTIDIEFAKRPGKVRFSATGIENRRFFGEKIVDFSKESGSVVFRQSNFPAYAMAQ